MLLYKERQLERIDRMIRLSNELSEEIKNTYDRVVVREDKVIYKHPKQTVTIPSKLYPLGNKKTISFFSTLNTKPIDDQVIKEAFDSFEFEVGRCYTNTIRLKKALEERGVNRLQPYVGWIMFPSSLPIHHSWLVYDDSYVLDGSLTKVDMILPDLIEEKKMTDIEEIRNLYAEIVVEEMKKTNSEARTFGQVLPIYLYVGTKQEPYEGAGVFNKLMEDFPIHPSYDSPSQNIDGSGLSETQDKILKLMNKR